MKKFVKILFFYPLYFLQLENYQLKRFYQVYFKKASTLEKPRQKLVLTLKIKVLILVSAIIILLAGVLFAYKFSVCWGIAASFILVLCFPFILGLSVIILLPLDILIKKLNIFQAQQKIKRLKNLKIVGITGSYGKTSFKEISAAILGTKYKVVYTPENKNTPLGVSQVILKNLKPETEIFVAEMSAWQKGDIKILSRIAPPGIAVLTGINESHLERFKTIENTINTKFEIVKYSKENALVVLNADNDYIIKNYKKYVGNKKVIFFGKENEEFLNYKIKEIIFNENTLKQTFILELEGKTYQFEIPFLGEYAVAMTIGAILIAKYLNLNETEIKIGLSLLKPIEHRLQPILRDDILIIDDSYNGNPNGAREAIKVLSRFKKRRKIYVTPGLVEIGKRSYEIHKEIGKLLAPVADLVILIKNSVTDFIVAGLKESGFNSEQIIIYNTPFELEENIKKIIRANDVVLFQNDWPDNYL
ncbi:MAG TPA: UDP-N-acetylmuramoyl-tripeptide--D-alanyl-D-alanine ligase [Candidatus Paceibacterota bacterium]|nr:UDP-N-acetylmuramoyl-tripeptide--D-alanyl-D-alanine ligase [Candidatus Paceibacterota bacterium]